MMININCRYFKRTYSCDYCCHPKRKKSGFFGIFKPHCIVHPLWNEKCGLQEELEKPIAPPPPKPPLNRCCREDGGNGVCPECGSSILPQIHICLGYGFGKKKCINPECDFEE